MNHYRITVSKENGLNWDKSGSVYSYMFRTDWIPSEFEAEEIWEELTKRFPYPLFEVTMQSRSKVMTIEKTNEN